VRLRAKDLLAANARGSVAKVTRPRTIPPTLIDMALDTTKDTITTEESIRDSGTGAGRGYAGSFYLLKFGEKI